MALHCTPLF